MLAQQFNGVPVEVVVTAPTQKQVNKYDQNGVNIEIGAPLQSSVIAYMTGLKGDTGDPASISADPNNAIKLGSDGRMLVDDVALTNCTADFLNIYQLSK